MKHEASKAQRSAPLAFVAPTTAGEIMTRDVVSVTLGTSVFDVARLLLEKRVSAAPVLGLDQQLVGMVSEGDLLGRSDPERLARHDWWLAMLKERRWTSSEPLEAAAARPVEQIMRGPVMTIEASAAIEADFPHRL